MSSKQTARACQPCRGVGSTRTICASVIIFTVPRPKGRSTRQTSISIGVPGSILWGERNRTPLELILLVRRDGCLCSRCPAMRLSRNGRLSFARVYARRSSTGRTACVGTRDMPFGFARVVHDGGSTTEVAEREESPSDSLRPESDWFMYLEFRAVRIGLQSLTVLAPLADTILWANTTSILLPAELSW